MLKAATYNVNGVNGRLPRLLEWLDEARPDIVCGQRSHHGVAILAKGEPPMEIRRGLPGDQLDKQARYLEAQLKGLVVASVYLPNGNPQPGPKFDFKLAWFGRLDAVVQPETRAAFHRLLEQGWIDATRHLHPDERIYTFLMLTPNLLTRLTATGVDRAHRGREKPSNHAPVWVQL